MQELEQQLMILLEDSYDMRPTDVRTVLANVAAEYRAKRENLDNSASRIRSKLNGPSKDKEEVGASTEHPSICRCKRCDAERTDKQVPRPKT